MAYGQNAPSCDPLIVKRSQLAKAEISGKLVSLCCHKIYRAEEIDASLYLFPNIGKNTMFCEYPLWKWNVIMYSNVTVSLTLVSNKPNIPSFSVLFQWEKFKLALWKLVSKKRAKFRRKMPGCFAVECQHQCETHARFFVSQQPILNWKGSRICAGTCVC